MIARMTFRERFVRTVRFETVDRLPIRHAYGLMPGVLDEWRSQGLPPTVESDSELNTYFGFPPAPEPLPIDLGPRPPFEEQVIEETCEYRVAIDRWGRKTRIMKGVTTLAQGKEWPVTDRETWRSYEERLRFAADRIGVGLEQAAEKNKASGRLNAFSAYGFYWLPRDLMGDEELAVSYYQDPGLVHSINGAWCSLIERVLAEVLGRIELDVIQFAEDMAYKNASMIGKHIFDEFMGPYYRRIRGIVERHGIPVFGVDTDGNTNELCGWFADLGVNLIGPNEVRAANDITEYRKRFGKTLAYFGGIDKLVLPMGGAAIDAMLDRIVPPMMESGGGWVVSLDHRVVPGTRLSDFRYYLERVRDLTTF